MPTMSMSVRPFEPGSYGWTAEDLGHPEIARRWDNGAYEIIEGVLASMPPVTFDGGISLFRLVKAIERHLERQDATGEFATRATLILNDTRIVNVDALFVTPEYARAQREACARLGSGNHRFGRSTMPPPLVIESTIPGYESHDRVNKLGWYAAAGIPHYWILDAFRQTLDCLVLDGAQYRIHQSTPGQSTIQPALFPNLTISAAKLWAD